MGLGPGSPCEFEDDTELFHQVERDLLLTTINSDWPTWGKTRAHVKVEHTSVVLQISSHAVIFWQRMPQHFLSEKVSLKGAWMSKAFGRGFYELSRWNESYKITQLLIHLFTYVKTINGLIFNDILLGNTELQWPHLQ